MFIIPIRIPEGRRDRADNPVSQCAEGIYRLLKITTFYDTSLFPPVSDPEYFCVP